MRREKIVIFKKFGRSLAFSIHIVYKNVYKNIRSKNFYTRCYLHTFKEPISSLLFTFLEENLWVYAVTPDLGNIFQF
jgi:hypothetical protein